MAKVNRARMVDAAEDLSKVLDLNPVIDVTQGSDELHEQLLEAAQLVREGDNLKPDTVKVLNEMRDIAEAAEEGESEVEQQDEKPKRGRGRPKGTGPKAEKAPKEPKAPKPPKEAKPARVTMTGKVEAEMIKGGYIEDINKMFGLKKGYIKDMIKDRTRADKRGRFDLESREDGKWIRLVPATEPSSGVSATAEATQAQVVHQARAAETEEADVE